VKTQRILWQIETHLSVARDILADAELALRSVGHDDSAAEAKAIRTQLRRLGETTRTRLAVTDE
jgi:hypothetical protein